MPIPPFSSNPVATFTSRGGILQQTYNVVDYGAAIDGSTDDTTAVNNAIAAAMTSGGQVFIPPGTGACVCTGALVLPTSAGGPIQKPLRIFGVGGTSNGQWPASSINKGSILDLRYAGGGSQVAKIDTRGAGYLEIDHLTLTSGGTDDYLFMQTTNTTVFIHDCGIVGHSANTGTACVQDFIKFGGQTQNIGGTATAAFQGYGSKLQNNYYSHIQRGSQFGNYCNGIEIENETFSTTCGSSLAQGAPYYFDPGSTVGNEAVGVRIKGGTVEMGGYPYMVSQIQKSTYNMFDSMGFYDSTPGTTLGQFYLGSGCDNCLIIVGFGDKTYPLLSGASADTGSCTVIDFRLSSLSNFPQGLQAGGLTTNGGIATLTLASAQGPHSWKWAAAYNDTHSISLVDVTNSNAQRIIVLNSGFVGIGKTNPATILDANGTVTATAFVGPLTGNVTGNASGTALNITGIAAIANGGTGSSVQNFVDLSTTQSSIAGAKTFTSLLAGANDDNYFGLGAVNNANTYVDVGSLGDAANVWFDARSSTVTNIGVKIRAKGSGAVQLLNPTTISGSLTLNTAGNKINITTGSNASAGTGTLSGGTVTISTTAVTASSLIFLTDTSGSVTNVGSLTVSAKSAGVSFTVNSTNVLDTSPFNWLIVN